MPSATNTKPDTSSASRQAPILVIASAVIGFGVAWFLGAIASAEQSGPLPAIVAALDLRTYFGKLLNPLAPFGPVLWLIGKLPLALLCGAPIVLLAIHWLKSLKQDDQSLLSSTEFDLVHRGVDTPPIDHLVHALRVCPDFERDLVLEDYYRAGLKTIAPPSVATIVEERPLTGSADPKAKFNRLRKR